MVSVLSFCNQRDKPRPWLDVDGGMVIKSVRTRRSTQKEILFYGYIGSHQATQGAQAL